MNYSNLPSTISLSCFEATARHLSVTLAANELFLTQSAVSRQIKRLEEQLQCILFLRVKQRLVLTEVGREYATQITKYMSELSIATEKVKVNKHNLLRIGAEPSLTARWLLPMIGDFRRENPGLTLDFSTDLKNLYGAKQGFDVAILYGDGLWPEFDSTYIMCPKMYAVCTPDLLKKYGPVTKRIDILKYPFLHHMTQDVASDLSSTQLWLTSIELSQSEISNMSSQNFEHFQFLLDAALHGLGITVLPSFFITEELKTKKLVKACEEPLIAKSYYIAVRKSAKENESCQHFKQWVIDKITTELKSEDG